LLERLQNHRTGDPPILAKAPTVGGKLPLSENIAQILFQPRWNSAATADKRQAAARKTNSIM
jgi:hypothetical protein